jgi:hypothetical protein
MILEVMEKMRQKVGMNRRKIIKREVRQKREMGRTTEKTRENHKAKVFGRLHCFGSAC